MTKKKRQHYIPQFYLKSFGKPVYRFDKTDNTIVPRNSKNIGHEYYFYDIDGLPTGTIEDFLAKGEDEFSRAYTRLIETPDLDKLTKKELTNFFLFMACQFLRTTEVRYDIKNMTEQVFDRIFGPKGMNIIPQEAKITYTEDSVKRFQIEMLLKGVPRIASLLYTKTWVIRKNDTDVPLWTSDNPIALHNDLNLGLMGSMGILSPGIEIHFPLTPSLILLSYDPRTSKITNEPMDKEHVRRHNCYQIWSSVQYLFSKTNDFSDAIEYLPKFPDLRKPDRPRGQVV